jgi:hypothetical protein
MPISGKVNQFKDFVDNFDKMQMHDWAIHIRE